MNTRAIFAVAVRDLKIVVRSKGVLIPLIVVPVIITILFPAGLGAFAPMLTSAAGGDTMEELGMFLDAMPSGLLAELEDYDETQLIIVLMLVYMFAPMFLIMPLMVASTIAANSFAGEKERKTLEALIYTPTTDTELFVGKMLAAWLPAVLVAIVSFILYGLSANIAAWPTMGEIFFPNAMWIVLVLWVTPAAAGLGLGTMILVSSKVSTFQEAYQIGSAVVLPVLLLMVGQLGGIVFLSVGVVLIVGLILWIIDLAVLYFAVRTFKRSEIIARL